LWRKGFSQAQRTIITTIITFSKRYLCDISSIDNRQQDWTICFTLLVKRIDIYTVLYKYKYYRSSELNLSKLKLVHDIGTVCSELRPKQDKRKTTCKKLKLQSGILPEKYQDYCNEAYGYSDHYWLWITYLDSHYSRNETRLPLNRSLYSQRTLFQVSFLI
jgi:hypothetical protein